ncbi:MAG: flagellar hook-basal body complex protein FliE [Pseudomonadota bacterium]
MTIDALRAAQAYGDIARTAASATGAERPASSSAPDFSALVRNAVAETSQSLKAGEAAAASVAAGEASLVDVVTAISAAEVTLETAVAVRNRVIEAYQEIMRMPI